MSLGPQAQANLEQKTVLITGASAGIGEAIAREFVEAAGGNIRLVLAARRADRLAELSRQLKQSGAQVHTAELDVSDRAKINAFFAALPPDYRNIDVLVNNAGKALGVEHAGNIRDEDVEEMFSTNVIGLIKMTQTVIRGMKERNSGDIVQVGSIAGIESYPGGSIYCATKSAVRSFTQAIRKELISTRIRVMEIDPGAVETEFSLVRFGGDATKASKVYEGYEPLSAKDIADVVVFNCSRRANVVVAESVVFPTAQAGSYHRHRSEPREGTEKN